MQMLGRDHYKGFTTLQKVTLIGNYRGYIDSLDTEIMAKRNAISEISESLNDLLLKEYGNERDIPSEVMEYLKDGTKTSAYFTERSVSLLEQDIGFIHPAHVSDVQDAKDLTPILDQLVDHIHIKIEQNNLVNIRYTNVLDLSHRIRAVVNKDVERRGIGQEEQKNDIFSKFDQSRNAETTNVYDRFQSQAEDKNRKQDPSVPYERDI